MYTLLLFFIRLFGDDEHDDVEFTFGSLSKKKEEEKSNYAKQILIFFLSFLFFFNDGS